MTTFYEIVADAVTEDSWKYLDALTNPKTNQRHQVFDDYNKMMTIVEEIKSTKYQRNGKTYYDWYGEILDGWFYGDINHTGETTYVEEAA